MQQRTEVTFTQYDLFTRVLHWAMGIGIIYVMIVGYSLHFISNPSVFTFFSEGNMSLGLVVAPLMIVRFLWRYFRPSVPYGDAITGYQKGLVHLLHEVFYLLIFVVLLSGILMLEKGFHFFGLVEIPRPVENLHINKFFFTIHRYSCITLTGMIALHIGAVIKHHCIEKNNILRRML